MISLSRNLITFGDSWPEGAELSPTEKTFGQLLSDRLECNFYNYAQGGTSIDNMVIKLDQFICSDDFNISNVNIAVFFLTSYHRVMIYDEHGNPQQIYSTLDSNEKGSRAYHWVRAASDELDSFRASLSVLALQKMCQAYAIKDFYILGWLKPNWTPTSGIDMSKFYDNGNTTVSNLFGCVYEHELWSSSTTNKKNQYLSPNENHPNQKGHQLISDTLHDWIEPTL